MRVLLDTCAFLWAILDDPALSPKAREVISHPGNDLYLSAASCWDIAIKHSLGKIRFVGTPEKLIPEQMHRLSIQALPVLIHHALHTATLKPLHRDPFDRLLVAQSRLERLGVLTPDPCIKAYGVDVLW